MRYEIEMSDSDGQTCRIGISLPLLKKQAYITNSTWKVLDEGFLKYRSGGCEMVGSWGPGSLHFYVGKAYGIVFNEFVDTFAIVNDSGDGIIYQPYCVKFKPGAISWVLLS